MQSGDKGMLISSALAAWSVAIVDKSEPYGLAVLLPLMYLTIAISLLPITVGLAVFIFAFIIVHFCQNR